MLWPLIWTKRYFHVSRLLGHVWTFLFAFSKSCKDFYTLEPDRLYITNAMKSWFCYEQFIFVLYWKLLCNTTETHTIANWRLYVLKGALLSHQTFTCGGSKCFHCAVCLHLLFDVLQIMTMVNVTKSRVATGIFGVAHTIHPIIVHLNIRFENTAFLLFFLTLWPLTSVRISVSHAHGCQSPAQEQSWISRWLH